MRHWVVVLVITVIGWALTMVVLRRYRSRISYCVNVTEDHGQVGISADACVDFPIFDAKSRSLKKTVMGLVGGNIATDQRRVPVIEALRNITVDLEHGARAWWATTARASRRRCACCPASTSPPGGDRDPGPGGPGVRPRRRDGPEISGFENIMIRGLFLGMSRKQMEERVDDIAEFTELGDFLRMPLRTTRRACGCGWPWAWSRASIPRSCCSTRASAPSTPRSSRSPSGGSRNSSSVPDCWCSPRTRTSSCAIAVRHRDLDGARADQRQASLAGPAGCKGPPA